MSEIIRFDSLIDKASFDTGTIAIAQSLERITLEITKAKDAAVVFSQHIGKELKKEVQSLSTTSKNLAKDMAAMEAKMNQFKQTTSNTSKIITDYEKENKKLTSQLEKLKQKLDSATVSQEKNTVASKKGSQGAAQLAQGFLGVASGAALLYRGIQGLGNQLSMAVTSMLEFEQAMKEVQAISRSSAEDLRLLTENANRLGATTEKTAGDVAKLQKELGKLGFNSSEILASTDAIVDLSTATGEGLPQSATVAAATLRAFGLEAIEMGRVVDVMAGSFVRSGLDLEKFRESMKLVAPIARAANIDLEVVTASLSKLADAGLSGSLAGTAMRNLLTSMVDPAEGLVQVMGKLDPTLKNGIKNSDDFARALKVLKDSNIDLEAAVDLVDVRAKSAFFTLVNQAEVIAGLAEEYRDLDGEAKKIAETMRDTLTNDIKIADSAFDAMRRNLVELFVPAMRAGAQEAATFSEFLRFMIDDISEATSELGENEEAFWKWALGIEQAKLLFGGLIDLYRGYVKDGKFDELRDSMGETGKSLKMVAAQASKELVVFSTLKKNLDEGKSLDGIAVSLRNLGAGYEDLLKKLEGGANEEKIAGQMMARLEANLKSAKSTLQIQKDQLLRTKTELEVLEKIRATEGKLTDEQSTKEQLLSVQKTFLEGFVDQNEKLLSNLEDQVGVKEKMAPFDKSLLENEKKKVEKASELLKLTHQLSEAKLKSEIEQLKFAKSNENDPSKRIALEQEYTHKVIELAQLKLKNELAVIEETYKADETYLVRRQLAYQKFVDELSGAHMDFAKTIDGIITKSVDSTDKTFEKVKDAARKGLDGLVKARDQKLKDQYKDEEDKLKDHEQKKQLIIREAAQALQNINRSIFDNRQIMRDQEMLEIQRWEERNLELAGDNERAKTRIKEEAAERERQIKIKQAKDNKAEAMFSILINTAQAVMATLGKTGVFGVPLAAIMGALGAAQLAVVAARPIPKFEKGTAYSPEGIAEVAERGRELIVDGKTGQARVAEGRQYQHLSKGSVVVPNAQTEQLLRVGQVDHNSLAFEALKRIEQKPQKSFNFDYERVEKALTNIPQPITNFDERGVRNYVIKGSARIERLNKRRRY